MDCLVSNFSSLLKSFCLIKELGISLLSTYLSKARYLFSEFNFSGAGSWYKAIITGEGFERVHAIINSSLYIIHDVLS